MLKFFVKSLIAQAAFVFVMAVNAHATTYSWNPVFDHVKEIRISVPVRESGLQFDRAGSLLDGQTSKFWIRRTAIKKIAFEEASRIIGTSRPDIKLYPKSFQSTSQFSSDPTIGPYENGRRSLSLALNISTIESSDKHLSDCYAGAVTATLIRGGFVGSRIEGGYRAEQEAEYLSSNGGYFTSPFIACGNIDEIDQVLRTRFSQVTNMVSEALIRGDKAAP